MATWASLSNKQKKKFGGDKKSFKAAKKEVRSTGASITSAKQVVKAHKAPSPSPTPAPSPGDRSPSPSPSPAPQQRNKGTASQVQNINSYDTTSYGSGNQKGTDKLSRADIKELTSQGFSDKEVVDYVENKWSGGTKGGNKAQALLNKYKERLTQPAPTEQVTAPAPPQPSTPAPTQGPRNAITPDMYQSPNSNKGTTTEGSSNTNTVNVGSGGEGNISVNQSNTQTFETVQDNDIVSSVTGDDNTLDNTQDNSLKNYGGTQTNDATVGGRGGAKDKAQSFINKDYTNNTGDTPTVMTPAVEPSKGTNFGSGNRNVNVGQGNDQGFKTTQDNDIITTVDGDNNTITNWQDNSIRNYGGDQKNFTYVGGKNPLTDSPVSAATMSGFYDVDDSPAKQAKFVDMYTTMNSDNQKRRKGMTPSIANEMITKANNLPGFDHRALDRVNRMSPQIARDRSTNRALSIFGDVYKAAVPDWSSPERQGKIEQPDYDELYGKYTDF